MIPAVGAAISADRPAATLPIRLIGYGAPVAAMSLAAAGDMGFGDDENRHRRAGWLRATGFDPDRAASVDLVHSRRVVEASRPERCRGEEADGLVCPGGAVASDTGRSSCLVITVADCMPVFLYDAGTGAYGLLHSGWKGTGILTEAVGLMARLYGTRPGDISATFGPRIGACCYVVDEERARAFSAEFGEASVDRKAGAPRLDLAAANLALAERLGLGSVEVEPGCTRCEDRFGSFRRQGPGRFTRMAAVIGYPAIAAETRR
jgi:hypothetical protein